VAAGLMDFEITWRADVFSGAPQASSAADFGTLGINFRARKPQDEQEWQAWLDTRSGGDTCALPPAESVQAAAPDTSQMNNE
jgi:hypothetical protein